MACSLFARVFVALSLMVPAVSADEISLQPNPASILQGDVVEVTATMDFQTPVVGGGFGLVYDPAVLTFESFTFDPSFTANFANTGPSPGATENPLASTFGWFLLNSPTGPTAIGVFRFSAAASMGSSDLVTQGLANVPFAGQSGNLAVTFGDAVVTVPEPALGQALAAGVAGLGLLHRRKRLASRS
ncbi:MAG: hypothetical protein OSB70_07865 [Myxococcota bacterium]|nr:hypothetical protein [Myxococcota bacterium]